MINLTLNSQTPEKKGECLLCLEFGSLGVKFLIRTYIPIHNQISTNSTVPTFPNLPNEPVLARRKSARSLRAQICTHQITSRNESIFIKQLTCIHVHPPLPPIMWLSGHETFLRKIVFLLLRAEATNCTRDHLPLLAWHRKNKILPLDWKLKNFNHPFGRARASK